MKSNNRIVIVDAMRGFALLGIVLIHFVEHFDFFYSPETHFLFSSETDGKVMEAVFFFISGKAYSIFALMFGFSFFIQMYRQEQKGIDFKGRFFWRLTILLIFGFIHSLVYKGDILHIYALLGFPLIFFYKIKTRNLLIISILLALQIPTICNLIASFTNPDFEYTQSFGSGYWGVGNETYTKGTFLEVVQYNFWKGRATVWGWTFYNGRYLQLFALFVLGLIVGRKKYFEHLENHQKNITKILVISLLTGIAFYFMNDNLKHLQLTETQTGLLSSLINSYYNLAYTLVLLSIFSLAYLKFRNISFFKLLASYGKMSLSNYVFQAVFGVIFFYGFGLAMYKYLGSTWSLLLGVIVFSLQIVISRIWAKHFYYGPLEWLWRAFTYLDFNIRFKKEHKN